MTRSHTLLHLVVKLFMWLQVWSLHSEIVNRIFEFWGSPVVDMFATVSKSHLPQFMSPIPEPLALAMDALSQDWQGRSMYMFLPFTLLSKVIQKPRATHEAEVILIALWWPKQPWFPHLLRLCVPPSVLSMSPRSSVSTGSEIRLG